MFIVNPMTNGEFFLSTTKEGFEVYKEIPEEVYNELELNRRLGKMYKIENIDGTDFEEIFQEYKPEIKEEPPKEGIEDYLLNLEYRLSVIELGV